MLGSLLVVLCFAASPAPPRPEDEMEFLKQHLAAPDFDWWTKFAKASDANDQRGMEDLTRRQKSNAENVFIHTEREEICKAVAVDEPAPLMEQPAQCVVHF